MDRFGTWIVGCAAGLIVYIAGNFFEAPLLRLFADLGFDRGQLSFGQILFFAIAASIALGAGGMYALTQSDWAKGFFAERRIRSLNDLEEVFSRPFAGWLPFSDDPLVDLADIKSALFEALSSMADRIRHDYSEAPPRHLLVTSTRPAEGKSTLSLGLARVWARRGHKVLLVDADLRNASLHAYLGMANTSGLSNILAGDDGKIGHVRQTQLGFDLVTAGPTPPNAAELLSTDRYADAIRFFLDRYDVVIVDTAPVLGLADAPALARQTGVILYVMRHGEVRPKVALDAFKRLTNLFKPQIILVGTGLRSRSSYGYGFRYGYAYEYRYDDEEKEARAKTAALTSPTPRDRQLGKLRHYGVRLLLLGVAVWLALQFFGYLRPARIAEMGAGIETVETRRASLKIDVAIGEYRGVEPAARSAGAAVEAIAKGVRGGLAELRPTTRGIDIRFYALRPDRLGNLVKDPQFAVLYARGDLAAVNLDVMYGAHLLDIASAITIIDPRFRSDVAATCKAKPRAPGMARLCAAAASELRGLGKAGAGDKGLR